MTEYSNMPIFAMRGNFFFPNVRAKVEIAREISRNAFRFGIDHGRKIFLVSQIDPDRADVPAETDLYTVGVIAKITSIGSATAEKFEIMVSTLEAARITRFNASPDLLLADVETLDYYIVNKDDARALFDMTVGYIKQYAEVNTSAERIDPKTFTTPDGGVDYLAFTNVVGNELVTRLADRQRLLEENNLETRMEKICAYIIGELDIAAAEKRVANRVKKQIADGQKEYYLREQMKAISAELGEDANEKQEYLDRIKACGMPQDVAEKANKELSRLSRMSSTSPDAAVIRNYLDWLCDVPWTNETQDNADLALARKILDEDHYGLDKIKDRIVEYLAVMQLTHKLNGPILCFVGPPGVGKTSIVKSIARALGRKYLRVSLGGVRDEAEIRGHRKTYVGAMPGRIISNIRIAGTMNPVFLLDEIDKLASDFKGDPSSALLEVLDPEQNNAFRDNYLEIPFDLSKVIFITTANNPDAIPAPLYDRMEIIEMSGYTPEEKLQIAKKHLIGKQLKAHGISEDRLSFTDDGIEKIIYSYTRESGVRGLEKEIANVMRKVAVKIVSGEAQDKIVVTKDNVKEYLGVEKYLENEKPEHSEVGAATGLAWTAVGGEILTIEVSIVSGKGEILLTGHLGDVMKESARTAISYIHAHADDYDIPECAFKDKDIHIHVPEGAIPKDGPSAGITIATAVFSALTGKGVRNDVAMTGEITLRGKVLPIGGLKEKSLAAMRAGIKKVLIPVDNMKDLADIPESVKNGVKFIPVENVSEVFNIAIER